MSQSISKTTFQKYPAYKNSGVDWLGVIPEGWKILPGLSFIIEGKDKNKGMKRNNVLSLSYGNIREKSDEELTGLVPESFETYQLVNKGDLIFRPTDLQNDKVSLRSSISYYDGIITSAYLNLRIKEKASAKFYHYFFRAIDNNKVIYGLGSGLRQNISYLDFRRFIFPFPPKEEQTAIANFLDDKCTKIDRVIAQKEKLIALLKERKQIIIQNAVTKGLDPNAKLKDSGVEWIGEIPEHWEVKRLKYVVKIIKRIIGFEGPDVLSITQQGIKIKDITSGEGQLAMDYSKYQIIKKGEFAMNHMDLLTGYVDITKFDGVISPDYRVFVPYIDEVEDKYLLGLFQVGYRSKIFYRYGQGVSQLGRWRLPAENFNQFSIPIPPKDEQSEIMEHIETQSAKIDKAIALQQSQIEKLKEYKATLIDSAVTGKIKVVK